MTTAPRPITPDDMADFTRLDDIQISPDGALVAFVAGEQFKTDSTWAKSRIWLVPTDGGAAHPLTGGPRADDTPRWSPDGRTLAFLSDRLEDGRRQIYLLDRAGPASGAGFTGVAEIGAWDQISYRASPYEQGGRYDRFSAIHYVDRVATPTLIVHGAEDVIVPVGQSYEFFRALKDHGVPTELVVYPREPHGFRLCFTFLFTGSRDFMKWLAAHPHARPAPRGARRSARSYSRPAPVS
jgi:dipeptidyl aminopeptidase/acylaminoacyl peptidase